MPELGCSSEHTLPRNIAWDGGADPPADRFGPSTLIEAGEQTVLIDVGRGATIRLFQPGIPIGRINALLLTHFHSDHTVGIPDLWMTGYLDGACPPHAEVCGVYGKVSYLGGHSYSTNVPISNNAT